MCCVRFTNVQQIIINLRSVEKSLFGVVNYNNAIITRLKIKYLKKNLTFKHRLFYLYMMSLVIGK
jgi:hypothetical protein